MVPLLLAIQIAEVVALILDQRLASSQVEVGPVLSTARPLEVWC